MDRLADRLEEGVRVNDMDELTEGELDGLRDLEEEMDIDLLAEIDMLRLLDCVSDRLTEEVAVRLTLGGAVFLSEEDGDNEGDNEENPILPTKL